MPTATPRTVLVAGSSGFIGTHLTRHLRRRGDHVLTLVRREPQHDDEIRWRPEAGELPTHVLRHVDAIVNLGGAGVGDKRWTDDYKQTILNSRVDGARTLSAAVASHIAAGGQPPRFLQASAVGYYGDRGDEVLDESSNSGAGFLADVCMKWEAATSEAEKHGASVAHLRTGLVLSPGGGALGRLLTLIKLGASGPLGSGQQWWPWITLADHVRTQLHLLDSALTGPVNLSAPGSARQHEVVSAIADVLHRPSILPAPGWALRLALGEFATEILASQRQVPQALLSDGFTFIHPTVRDAAAWIGERS